jgi:tetratricopeptide (TPR) repeat protein
MMAEGLNEDEILLAYPDLERDDVREALKFAAEAIGGSRFPDESHEKDGCRKEVQASVTASEESLELVALVVKRNAIRAKYVATGEAVTFRPLGGIRWDVEGEILAVKPSKAWKHGRTQYLSGTILWRRLDIGALGLVPLELHRIGTWDPADEYWAEEYSPIEECLKPVIAVGPRPMFEMEQSLPGGYENGGDYDPICDAVELRESGDYEGADRIMETLLIKDLRCIDAHAHLGNWSFALGSPLDIEKAKRHYEVGMSIAALTLGRDFDGVLLWSHIDNRPYLRCLHGFGLCQWRLGDFAGARETFTRLLWLNPRDNQGARGLVEDVEKGLPWSEEY